MLWVGSLWAEGRCKVSSTLATECRPATFWRSQRRRAVKVGGDILPLGDISLPVWTILKTVFACLWHLSTEYQRVTNRRRCCSCYGLSTLATKLPKTNGNKLLPETATKSPFLANLLPFRATMLPFSVTIASATICCRFQQLCCLVWSGLYSATAS